MLRPIQSLCLVADERDTELTFAAVFAAEEITRLSDLRPPIVDRSEVVPFPFTIILAWFHDDREGVEDSYELFSSDASVTITSASMRGLLYGIGRLLRLSPVQRGCLNIPTQFRLESDPYSRVRGHQIGYGRLSNSMDSWTVEQFDRYIRDLILFGCNTIEIEYKPDPSPYHILPFVTMVSEISRIATRYDLDCTLWIPNWEDETYYRDRRSSNRELGKYRYLFESFPKISAITVPGGDPGSLRPGVLFPWVERLVETLESCGHPPSAWISAQWMRADRAWYEEFLNVANRRPPYLTGIVHGPWTQLSIPELRLRLCQELPIRRYTDLSHCIFCEYPVTDWDLAYAMTCGRESINPRPIAYKKIHNLFCAEVVGSTPHTTGINADINVFVWLDQEWDPSTRVEDTLRDYARVLVDPSLEEAFGEGILALERNWKGPLISNRSVDGTLEYWRRLERTIRAPVARLWRFQSPLLRAYYDAFIRRRLLRETATFQRVVEHLSVDRSRAAILRSLQWLQEPSIVSPEAELRERCTTLSEELFQSIGLKSSVPRHGAAQRGRGAFMDAIDEPLTDSKWLAHGLNRAVAAGSPREREEILGSILKRTLRQEVGIHDNLGTVGQIGEVVNPVDIQRDPGGLAGSRSGFGIALEGMPRSQTVEIVEHEGRPISLAWLTCLEATYDTPLTLSYRGLDANRAYELSIVYPSRIGRKARLVANDTFVVHECIVTGDEARKSFIIPLGVVRRGELRLQWTGEGERGIQVAELWLTAKSGNL